MLIRNARMPHTKVLIDITIKEGIISQITPVPENRDEEQVPEASQETQDTVIDAGGNMVSPPFIDPHVHLDAVFMSDYVRPNLSGTLLEGIAVWGECKRKADIQVYKEHARKALTWYAAQGVLTVRSHVDTTVPGQKNIEALLEVRDELKHLVEIQLVAFPQDGIYTYADGEKDLRRAMEMGCDAVGGIPHNEITREDGVRDVEYAFRLADEFDAYVDIHCDETGDPQSRFIEVMAKETLVRDMGRRTAASHVTAMHNYDNDYAFKLIGILARSGMSVITNPFDNTFLMNRNDGYPRRRGHTRVDELHAANVNISIGHDSIMDPWYPLGQGSMLQAANLLLHIAHMTSAAQIEALFDMITVNSARVMGISGRYGIEAGKPADLIILDAPTVFESLRLTPDPLYVIKNGEVISRTEPRRFSLTLGDQRKSINLKQSPRG